MEKTNQPLYQQLMEDVRSQIENSLLLPGDKLPTEREFMQKYNVSRITVSKALNELKAEGLITAFQIKAPLSPEVLLPLLLRLRSRWKLPVSCCRLLPPRSFLLSRKAVPLILLLPRLPASCRPSPISFRYPW